MKLLRKIVAAAAAALLATAAFADVNIGVTLSLTGPASGLGIPVGNQFKLWPQTIAGEKVNLIILDDASDPGKGVGNARRFVTDDKVDMIFGGSITTVSAAIAPVASEAKTTQISIAPVGVPPEPRIEDPLKVSDIDKINQNSPFQPVLFRYDSAEIEGEGQGVLNANAAILKKYPEWVITIEGHSDERGTAEYNLALGNRRAAAARTYLISLGITVDRLRTVSYGKEFPFDPTHNESGWSKNRRAHFVLTSK